MENGPVEDVFPIEDGDFPASHVSFREGKWKICFMMVGNTVLHSGFS